MYEPNKGKISQRIALLFLWHLALQYNIIKANIFTYCICLSIIKTWTGYYILLL